MRMAYDPSGFIGHECQRSGSMAATDALVRYGNKPMPELRYDFARELDCHRGHDAPFNDKCQIPTLPGGGFCFCGTKRSTSSPVGRTPTLLRFKLVAVS
jgi:hypothetical protein